MPGRPTHCGSEIEANVEGNETKGQVVNSSPCSACHAKWAGLAWRLGSDDEPGPKARVPEYARNLVHSRMNTYMATKKTGPTLAELNAQIAELQAQAEALSTKEVAEVVARIRDAIVHYGLTAADLGLGSAKTKTPKGAAVVATAKSKGKAAGKKPARIIKYSDGQGGSWSGIGKRPTWFKDALAAGKKPEDLLVKPEV